MHKLQSQKGSVLTVILIFATCAFFTVSTFVLSQFSFSKEALVRPRRIQALMTARSGIILGIHLLNKDRSYKDPEVAISDSLTDPFGYGLFGDDDEQSTVEDTVLSIGGEAITLSPFVDTSFGLCTLEVKSSGNYLELTSVGRFLQKSAKVTATLGSLPFVTPDTVLYLEVAGHPEGPGSVSGMISSIAVKVDSGAAPSNTFHVSRKDLESSLSDYKNRISLVDSGLQQTPLTITENEQLKELPGQIEGSLMLDGQYRDLHWASESTMVILGDLQTTGDVVLEDLELIVGGEVKLFDNTQLKNVTIFSQSRVYLGNQSRFQGQITAESDIEIYDDAVVEAPSCIVATGGTQKRDAAAEGIDGKFTLHVRNRSSVEAVLISTRAEGGILTEPETTVKGILWAEGRVCHQGQLQGIIKAKCLVTEENPFHTEKNMLEGSIEPLERVSHYVFPFYIGDLSVTAWKEKR